MTQISDGMVYDHGDDDGDDGGWWNETFDGVSVDSLEVEDGGFSARCREMKGSLGMEGEHYVD